jgi:hypothetical protein
MRIGHLFIEHHYNQSKIPTATFSFALKGYSSDMPSAIDFGNPVLSQINMVLAAGLYKQMMISFGQLNYKQSTLGVKDSNLHSSRLTQYLTVVIRH